MLDCAGVLVCTVLGQHAGLLEPGAQNLMILPDSETHLLRWQQGEGVVVTGEIVSRKPHSLAMRNNGCRCPILASDTAGKREPDKRTRNVSVMTPISGPRYTHSMAQEDGKAGDAQSVKRKSLGHA
eukprot:3161131-Rhodomonas_salina.1